MRLKLFALMCGLGLHYGASADEYIQNTPAVKLILRQSSEVSAILLNKDLTSERKREAVGILYDNGFDSESLCAVVFRYPSCRNGMTKLEIDESLLKIRSIVTYTFVYDLVMYADAEIEIKNQEGNEGAVVVRGVMKLKNNEYVNIKWHLYCIKGECRFVNIIVKEFLSITSAVKNALERIEREKRHK